MFTVMTSLLRSAPGASSSSSVLIPTSVWGARSAIVAFGVGEGGGLPAHWEVGPLWPADVVLGHQDPPQVGVSVEDDPGDVEDPAHLEVGGGEEPATGCQF